MLLPSNCSELVFQWWRYKKVNKWWRYKKVNNSPQGNSPQGKTNLSIGRFLVGSHRSPLILCRFSFQAFQATTSPLKPETFNLLIFYASSIGAICRNSENLLLFDVDESLYSERWSSYLIGNFLKTYENYKVQTQLL